MDVAKFRGNRTASGRPGLTPWWTNGNKDGVGTAYASASRIWFTLFEGVLTEIYYPTVDRPQLRDLQLLVADGGSFLHGEREMRTSIQRLSPCALGYHITNADPQDRYRIHKEIIADPYLPCILQQIRFEGDDQLHLYALCAPHLAGGGYSNNAYVVEVAGQEILVAERGGTWLAMGATRPFRRLSVGYVGQSDGWTDLARNHTMTWLCDRAPEGNVALTGECDLTGGREFTLGVAFGDGLHSAVTTLFQSLGVPFSEQKRRFLNQWQRPHSKALPLRKQSTDGGHLYRTSVSLLLAHEDKQFPGALIASLSIPWGEALSADGGEGYHFVWTRDMVNSATGLMAAGNTATPLRALIYLATSQQPDGGFPQNFWINGEPHWRGIQLDEVAFPILLAWRLDQAQGLQNFDPYPMVLRAASYLMKHGPATQQERWEENSGYSPSTLAVSVAALICAGCLARDRGDESTAMYMEEFADFLECHIEAWTVTRKSTLHPNIPHHYIRIAPKADPDAGLIRIANLAPGAKGEFPASDIVDAGFLELVRYGLRPADDPLIVDSLTVVDALLRVEAPQGPVWRRYNHDGYGQRPDWGPYKGWGQGRAWPLLTGERAHYELAAGRPVRHLIQAIERFASPTGMLPEQVWDQPDELLGKPTGAAMPLMWAHAEYIKLLRSVQDGRVFDLIDPVVARYQGARPGFRSIAIWKENHRPERVDPGTILRVQVGAPFLLRWSADNWQTSNDSPAISVGLGLYHVDLDMGAPVHFTFYWLSEERWEGRDYIVEVQRTSC